jgi:hypothetical protein
MATKNTDWKKERDKLKQVDPGQQTPFPAFEPWDDKGREMLSKGTRQSLRNDLGSKATSMETLMRMWQENQDARLRNRKNKKHMPLKGLFGGGE